MSSQSRGIDNDIVPETNTFAQLYTVLQWKLTLLQLKV